MIKIRVAIYCRKSVFVEGSVSIETQINLCKDYINKKYPNATFEIFEDEGFSGGNTNRPAFQKMLKLIDLKQLDIVICYKIDRIARNTLDFLNTLEKFKQSNVELISVSEGFDPNTQMGKMMLTLLASFAEMERSNIQQRVSDNMLSIAKKGKWTGGSAPTGFINGKNGGLEISNADLIYDLFTMKYNNNLNSEIISYIKEKHNHTFQGTTLASSWRKPIYVKSSKSVSLYLKHKGYTVLGDENLINSYLTYTDKNSKYAIVSDIPGLIEPDVWIAVNKKMDENISREGNRFSEKYWLTKTLRCKCCGKTYCGHTKKTRTKYYTKDGSEKIYESIIDYYMCRDMLKGKLKTCTNTKRIKKDHIEDRISKLIYKLKNRDVFNSSYNKNSVNNKKAILILEKKIKTLDKNINNLTDKLTLLSNEASVFIINRIEMLTNEKTKIKNEIIELEMQELESINVNYDYVFYTIRSFNDNMTVDEKRASVMNIFQEIIYDPETDTFEFSFK